MISTIIRVRDEKEKIMYVLTKYYLKLGNSASDGTLQRFGQVERLIFQRLKKKKTSADKIPVFVYADK